MIINQDSCTACGKCIDYCPMEAIRVESQTGKKPQVIIDRDECVECGVCLRADVCATDAITEEKLQWPREIRKFFSDPLAIHKGTNVPGRGTEEMKTNDVTGRFRRGYIGVGLEFGRPGVGTRLTEPEKAIRALRRIGIELEPLNPLTQLIDDPETGKLRQEVRNEKVLSAIVEFVIPIQRIQEVLNLVKEIAQKIDTVFSLSLISRTDADENIPLFTEMSEAGMTGSLNGKVNLGLGKPLFSE